MENTETPEVQNEVTTEVENTKDEAVSPEASTEPTKPLSKEEQLEALKATRLGKFKVNLSIEELKYIKNYFRSDVQFTGANEAYLVTTTSFALAQVIPTGKIDKTETPDIELPATTIEAISYFLNKKSGKGEDSARKLFSVVFKLQPVVNQLQNMSNEINKLSEPETGEKQESSSNK